MSKPYLLERSTHPDYSLDQIVLRSSFLHHSLATPLQSLQLALELCQIEAAACQPRSVREKLSDHLHLSLNIADQLESLFGLLSTERKDRWFNPVIETEQVIKSLELVYPQAQITLKTTKEQTTTQISGNVFLFQEVLRCLITNALESYGSTKKQIVILQISDYDQRLQITVIDGGSGFSKPIPSALRLSESSKPGHQGIGLAAVKTIMEHHFGGRLEISTQSNKGSQVQLTFGPDVALQN